MRSRVEQGFTLIEIMIVILITGIVLSIAIPTWLKSRTEAQAKMCQENQVQLLGAVDRWAFVNNKKNGDAGPALSEIVGTENILKRTPKCPVGPVAFQVPAVGADPVCPNLASAPEHVLP